MRGIIALLAILAFVAGIVAVFRELWLLLGLVVFALLLLAAAFGPPSDV